MNRCVFPAAVVLLVSCTVPLGCAAEDAAPPVAWEVSEGIVAPECVCYDPASRSVFVSNIGEGGPTGKDGDGYLSKLDTDGQVVKTKWATGLNAPKGMRVQGGTLWVTDIDRLVGIELASGQIAKTVPVPTATFLNDVACAADGTVYVSDTMLSRIFRYGDGEMSLLVEGEDLECPNGLLVDGDRLIVAAWGRAPADDFSTKVPGRLLSVDLKTKQWKAINDQPVGNLDGLESDGQGGFYVTDWIQGQVLHVSKSGAVEVVAKLTKGTADLAYLPAKKMLIVPRMMENKVTALDLSK